MNRILHHAVDRISIAIRSQARGKFLLAALFIGLTTGMCWAQSGPLNSHVATPFKNSSEIYFNADARKIIQPGSQSADKVSANSIGNDLTLLFDGARIDGRTANDPLTGSWASTIAVPINATGQKLTSYVQHIRGAVTKDANSRVCLLVSLGGKTFVKEYPYGTKSNGDFTWTLISPIRMSAAPRYDATMLVLVERRDEKSVVLVSVDSLDVQAKLIKKATK